MHKLKISKIAIGCILLFLFSFISVFNSFAQKLSDEKVKSTLIFNFPKYIEWPSENDAEEFIIGVYGATPLMYSELAAITKNGYSDGTQIKLINFAKISDFTKTHILYVGPSKSDEIKAIFDKITGNNTLLVTDQCDSKKNTMINFLAPDKNGRITFETNKPNIQAEGLKVSSKLTDKGADIIMQDLYKESEKELKTEKEKVIAQKNELDKQKEEINAQNEQIRGQKNEINKQKDDIARQKNEIQTQQKNIEQQRIALGNLFIQIGEQKKNFEEKVAALAKKESEIKAKEDKIKLLQVQEQKQTDILKNQKDAIQEQQDKIEKQKLVLTQQSSKIERQSYIIYISMSFILLFVGLVFFIYRSYKIKKEANIELEKKNFEIHRQKEEIEIQALQLELNNMELEKLSIVASETDNAVVIMDAEGYYIWVNDGYQRLFGYNFDELMNINNNIINTSTSENIKNLVKRAINKKESVIFENLARTKTGKELWIQTTLTPIFDQNNQIKKLVAIDSDISRIKEYEKEILEQRDQLKFQNENITASIKYAKTIQQAILPQRETLLSAFESFLIFRPKDIVSGDFYWFSRFDDENKIFMAVVDCTGHGVPGAFMSMIGNRLLNEIVNERRVFEPNKILEYLNVNIQKALMQSRTSNNDGMDVCLCAIEKKSNSSSENFDSTKIKVTFAGAKRPLYFKTSDKDNIQSIKGDVRTIGGKERLLKVEVFPFTNHEIWFNKGDMIYLTSDGLVDQNSPTRKRFGYERMFEALISNITASMEEQGATLEKALDKHQAGAEQRDDITMIGIRL